MSIVFSLIFLVIAIIMFSISLSLFIVKLIDDNHELNLRFMIVILLLFGTVSFALSASLSEVKLTDQDKDHLNKIITKFSKGDY